ncbi:allophanate hydrolase subunit 1 [Psychromonas sp.]|uniref:5-oxoprolinase subunit B family protein n=1 Tax=Psychromonas sp. TaxID=1884585 RepID=UPI003567636A
MQITAVNENCFLIQVADHIDLSLTDKIAYLTRQIELSLADSLLDITPSYSTVLVQYDLLKVAPLVVEKQLESIVFHCAQKNVPTGCNKVIELPVYYAPCVGWDLPALSAKTGLSVEQIITLHSDNHYRVCAVGFAPGFAFLAQVPQAISIARHRSPRAFVPAGSVAIADTQTAVYPSDGPGGWQLIGNCPSILFDLNQEPVSPFAVGDYVKFKPVSRTEFIDLGGKVIDER